jgi:hypothetical protein
MDKKELKEIISFLEEVYFQLPDELQHKCNKLLKKYGNKSKELPTSKAVRRRREGFHEGV